MRKWKSKTHLLMVIWITAGLGGCKVPFAEPDFISSKFNALEIDTIYIMPTIEYASKPVPYLDSSIRKGTKQNFIEKGYKCIWLQDKSLVSGIKRSEFSEPNAQLLANIGPPEARWLLYLVFYEGTTTSLVLPNKKWITSDEIILRQVTESVYRLSAYLFDTSDDQLIWSNNATIGKIVWPEGVRFASGLIMDGLPYK